MKKPKKAGKLRTKIVWAVLILTVAVIITPWGRAFYKTLIILPEFIPNSPIKTANLLTRKPQVKEVEFKSEDRTIYADIWYPNSSGKHPAAVLHLGIDIDRKDIRAQKLANAFARSGIITLIPNIPSLGQRRLLPEGKKDLIASFEFLKSQPNVKFQNIGYIGFCASGGLVLLASEDPKIADQVKFVVTVNPYFDLLSLYEHLTLRQVKDNGQTLTWKPNFKTVEIYNRETINLLESREEQKILNNHLVLIDQDRLENGNFEPLSQMELAKLSKKAKFTYEFLTNKDQTKVLYYQENTTSEQKAFIKDLSPSTNIENLKAKTFILMDKNNIYTPYTEAQLLNNALEGKNRLHVETKILPAGDLVQTLPAKDYLIESLKIFRFVYSVLLKIT